MKDWFPFTDYDFYSYLSCGLIIIFGVDIWSTGGENFVIEKWTFLQCATVIAFAYIVGQVASIPSSIILEHGVARKLLRPPASILLSNSRNWAEKFIECFLLGRHYSPLPQGVIEKIYTNAEVDSGLTRQQLQTNIKEIFVLAIRNSRKSTEVQNKINFFRNQYSFGRNMAFSFFVLAVLFTQDSLFDDLPWNWAILSFVLGLGMFLRFLKFYSCCATEVLTSYAYK